MEALDILKVIQPIGQKGQNETARRLLQIIGQIYRFAVITGRAKRNPVTDLSGAIRTERSRTERPLPSRKRWRSFCAI